MIGECGDDPDNIQTEAFTLEIACQLIGDTNKKEKIQVIKQDEEWALVFSRVSREPFSHYFF